MAYSMIVKAGATVYNDILKSSYAQQAGTFPDHRNSG
jgi:hypothetical protein